jgi:cytochrome b pre-mRNA-processing protein 3
MYLLSARFRDFKTDPTPWQQHLLDHFSYDAENKMTTLHNMEARGTRNKYLKDLYVQWRGLLAAYDEGLAKGDAVLAAAVWRNVFKANEDVNIKGLALVVSYMRRTLKGLDELPDEKVMLAEVGFGSPKAEEAVVKIRSPMLDLPFEKAQGKPLLSKKNK